MALMSEAFKENNITRTLIWFFSPVLRIGSIVVIAEGSGWVGLILLHGVVYFAVITTWESALFI